MNPLIVNLIIVSLVCLLYQVIPNKNIIITRIFIFSTFICLLYMHSMVDVYSVPDLEAYLNYYDEARTLSFREAFIKGAIDDKVEVGYVVFNKLISYISPNFRAFLWVYSIVLLLLYYKYIISVSPYVTISILFLLVGTYNQSLFVLRQHLAVALLLYSYTFITERKILPFLIILLLAYSLHRTAIIFTPVYFLYGLNKTNLIKSFIVVSILLIVLMRIVIVALFANYFSFYQGYLDNDVQQNYKLAVLAGGYFLLYIFFLKNEIFDDGINRFTLIILYFYFIIFLSGIGLPVGRLAAYFSISTLTAIPLIMSRINKVLLRVIVFLLVFSIQYYITFMGSSVISIDSIQLVSLF